ncbi:hypothetical protein [Candidatus Magnetobacterium casense]|uniref:Uncharacterized protein n=1 Tax=Candidatus Magnetobacterium casense TaxID=1455061 RepID=A0ABS6S0D5_9BACT|nr:hypothetical protein [Candidatus Magnetobacterium casensis]MBV6342313.1 hypothetical protein [Candidatus Magnetobacterium casensis]
MFKCKVFPYPIGSKRPEKVIPAALLFIDQWEAESAGERPFVTVKCFGEPATVFIGPGFRHIRESRNILDVARRFRFLPCVKELLTETTEAPDRTRDGNFMLEGKAPTNEIFRVILGEGPDGYRLITFYPVQK